MLLVEQVLLEIQQLQPMEVPQELQIQETAAKVKRVDQALYK
jgi:hypothetical protein